MMERAIPHLVVSDTPVLNICNSIQNFNRKDNTSTAPATLRYKADRSQVPEDSPVPAFTNTNSPIHAMQ